MLTNGREISLIRNKSGTEFGVCKGFHADQVSNIFGLAHGIGHINGKGVVGRVPHNNDVFGSGGSCYRHGKKLVLAAGNASVLHRFASAEEAGGMQLIVYLQNIPVCRYKRRSGSE